LGGFPEEGWFPWIKKELEKKEAEKKETPKGKTVNFEDIAF